MKSFKTLFIFLFLFFAPLNLNAQAKYVILFIADGMSAAAESSLSRYLHGKDLSLVWNGFPVQTFATTWSLSENASYEQSLAGAKPYPYYFSDQAEEYFKNAPSTDSAASATAMATGQKTFNQNISWKNNARIENISDIIKKDGVFNIALVTTAVFYDATPAAFSSHNKSRNNYKQIAQEILSQTKPELIFAKSEYYYLNDFAKQNGYYALTSKDLETPKIFDGSENKKIFIRLVNYSVAQAQNKQNFPDFIYKNDTIKFKDIVSLSLNLMLEKRKPFFIVAEQSDIDTASHDNNFVRMLGAVYELEDAVKTTVDLISSEKTDMNWNNSLIVVTADHSTGFLRFNEFLKKGMLPDKNIVLGKKILKLNKSIDYKSRHHTNELVGCYAIGKNSHLFLKYINEKYDQSAIIDNTDIFKVLKETVSKK